MCAASYLLIEDQFLCSICLGVFTDPVSTPCGHNFCQTCLTEHWDANVPCSCPNCNEVFHTMPKLLVNTLISGMAAQFRQQKDRMCKMHNEPLVLFCQTDQMCVCALCILDHKLHELVPLREEYEGKKAKLGDTEAEIQQMIQKRQLKIQEMRCSVTLGKEGADREIAGGVEVFTALKESVERIQRELIHTIEEKQRETETQAEEFITELEQEIADLEKRRTEVNQLSQSADHLHLLLNFLSLNSAPPTKDWTEITVIPHSYEGTVVRSVRQLEKTINEQMKKLFKAELERVQQDVDVLKGRLTWF